MASDDPGLKEEVKGVAREARSAQASDTKPLRSLQQRDLEQDVALKGWYARNLLPILVGQLLVADTVFVLYAWLGVDWKVEASVMQAWLAATVVEVIGIVLVVIRYLFPRRDRRD